MMMPTRLHQGLIQPEINFTFPSNLDLLIGSTAPFLLCQNSLPSFKVSLTSAPDNFISIPMTVWLQHYASSPPLCLLLPSVSCNYNFIIAGHLLSAQTVHQGEMYSFFMLTFFFNAQAVLFSLITYQVFPGKPLGELMRSSSSTQISSGPYCREKHGC